MTRARITRFGPPIHVPICLTRLTPLTALNLEWEIDFGKKESLGAHSECNVKKQVAYVLRFRDPKSLGAYSGDR